MTRAEAKAVYAMAKTPADLRALALGDLFFFLVVVLGRADADNDWIFDRCREVQADPDGRLDLWAREHYKSTIITVARTMQDILRDPEIAVGIFSHTRPVAKSFLRQIKREFENNALLHELFPDVLWGPKAAGAPTWSEDAGLIVRRRRNPKECTVEAWGLVDGQPTGKHFDLMIYDDVVTRESVTTPDMIRKVTDAWALSLNLGARGGRVRYIGTRYHHNDTYAEIMRRKAATPRLHPATLDGTPEGRPVLLAPEKLAEKRRQMGPYIFGCQMLQNPLADAVMGFKEAWLRDVEKPSAEGLSVYLLADPASSKKERADYSVFAVVGLGPDLNYYLLDGVRDRLNLTERAETLFRLHRRWRPLAVGYERYGMQADVEFMKAEMERRNYRFPLTELGGPMPKPDRIRRLAPLFERGRFFLPRNLPFIDVEGRERDFVREFIEDEYLAFPVAAHDDMLDAISRIVDPDLKAAFPMEEPARPAKPRLSTFAATRAA
jgi:predicted phage terminase large subunit-like protein